MADLKALAEELVGLTVKEVSELANILKEEHGIEPAAAAVAIAAPSDGDGGGAVEEQTEFNVMLNSAGAAKLKVVKEVEEIFEHKNKAKQMGLNARTFIIVKFSKDKILNSMLDQLNKI